ncbi:MAG: hypothetical protein A4E20_15460 [Nitrospira sp. SG-bin2]|nr:MAG: hypothetical protein A4E20_15460 [Nitrospira sp. SG-bin2]
MRGWPRKREEERYPYRFLAPRARTQDHRICRLWVVLAQQAQWNQHGCRSEGKKMSKFGRIGIYTAVFRDFEV